MILHMFILSVWFALGESTCRLQNPNCKNYKKCNTFDFSCDNSEECVNYDRQTEYCSPCNTTYFGEVGHTYELKIKRPLVNKIPFLCFLNFTATEGNYGDLVQLNFETFAVGTFESFTVDGCPNGYMTIREHDRPDTQGKWCGSAWGYTVYYSETSSVNITLFLKHLHQQSPDSQFEFKLSYKFLRAREARLRYGNFTQKLYRGKLQKNTYCDRLLEDCSRRPCKIQSPNYPGIYPRNVTCHYRVKEKQPPPGKHALIAMRQVNSQNKENNFKIETGDNFRIWDQCDVMQEYVEVRDGLNQNSSLLAHFCTIDTMPEIISSGPELLITFHTSPFGNPFHPLPLSHLPGFEFEIEIFYVDKESSQYIEDGKKCEFMLTPIDNSSGFLQSPRHSLPPNTTCRYHFKGQKHEVIWITFIKYYVAGEKVGNFGYDDCNVELQLWDGDFDSTNTPKQNALISRFCKDEKPKLCDHSLLRNATRTTRPCEMHESYVSSGSELSISFSNRYGNVLLPVQFLLKYEFVDLFQEGYNMTNTCDRIFRGGSGKFSSPKTTFLYGRGGQRNLKCSYIFEFPEERRLRLVFTRGVLGKNTCSTSYDKERDIRHCIAPKEQEGSHGKLEVIEYPWLDVSIPVWCYCQNFSFQVNLTTKIAEKVVVVFSATNMSIADDFNDFNFEGSYEYLPLQPEPCTDPWKTRRLHGKSGEITIRNIDTNNSLDKCVHQPWLIEPSDSYKNFLYLKIKGLEMQNTTECRTDNRILVYSALYTDYVHVICPSSNDIDGYVELFSEGWSSLDTIFMQTQTSKSFVVEFLQKQPGEFLVSWIEVSRNPALSLSTSLFVTKNPDCPHSCPELGACISADLWCDGLVHCPSGNDEEEVNCSLKKGKYIIQILTSSVVLAALLSATFMVVTFIFWKRWKTEKKTAISSVTDHTFLDFKTGFC